MKDLKREIGMMRGKQMDGIEIDIIDKEGEKWIERRDYEQMDYQDGFRERMKEGIVDEREIKEREESKGMMRKIENEMKLINEVDVNDLIKEKGLKKKEIEVIGFNGKKVMNRQKERMNVKIGEGEMMDREKGINVVYEMREEEMRNGGKGDKLIKE